MSINIHPYKTTVDIPYGKLQKTIEWCTDHCQHDWSFGIIEMGIPGKYMFSFTNEKDYITFLLVTK